MEKDEIETHILSLNDTRFRISYDPWTGDWLVDSPEEMIQGTYLLSKRGAIDYCLERVGMIEDAEYKMAPDRTSA